MNVVDGEERLTSDTRDFKSCSKSITPRHRVRPPPQPPHAPHHRTSPDSPGYRPRIVASTPDRGTQLRPSSLRPVARRSRYEHSRISVQPLYPTSVEVVISLDNAKFPFVSGMLKNCALSKKSLSGSVDVIANSKGNESV